MIDWEEGCEEEDGRREHHEEMERMEEDGMKEKKIHSWILISLEHHCHHQ